MREERVMTRHYRTVDQARLDETAWAALAWGAERCADDPELDEPAVCECGLTIHEDRGARNNLGDPICYRCEMDILAREQRYD
jgi:hypothetical protein